MTHGAIGLMYTAKTRARVKCGGCVGSLKARGRVDKTVEKEIVKVNGVGVFENGRILK